jgi:hypothetical protein
VTDQPSQPPSDEKRDDVPAQVGPDASTQVSRTGPATDVPPAPSIPPPSFGTTEPGPTPYEDSSPSGLAKVFPPEHPEYAVGAAFGGGLALALILKRLAH